MRNQTPETLYEKFLLPEHLSVIHNSASQRVGVPVFLTNRDLVDLFNLSANDLTTLMSSQIAIPIDPRMAPIDEDVRKSLAGPKTKTTACVSKNALVLAFSLLGHASSLGRKIECAAAEIDDHRQIRKDGKTFQGHINPSFFEQFNSDPLTGSQTLFGEINKEVGSPDTLMIVGFISPNPQTH